MRLLSFGLAAMFLAMGLAACSSDPVPAIAEDYPSVDGSTSAEPLQGAVFCEILDIDWEWYTRGLEAPRLIGPSDTAYDEDPRIFDFFRDHVSHNGTHSAYMNLISGQADLILVAREPSIDELEAAATAAVNLDVQPVALDAFVFLANDSGPVRDLPLETIRQIYSGSITTWDQAVAGAAPNEIVPFVRNRNSGSQELMEKLVMRARRCSPQLPTWCCTT